MIHLTHPTDIRVVFRFIQGTDATLQWDRTEVYRLPAFDSVRHVAAG